MSFGYSSGFGESGWRRRVSEKGVELRGAFAGDGGGIPLIRFAVGERHGKKTLLKTGG